MVPGFQEQISTEQTEVHFCVKNRHFNPFLPLSLLSRKKIQNLL